MKIGVDLDEVLAETVNHLLEKNNYKIGDSKIKYEEITDYYIFKIKKLNICQETALNLFREVLIYDKNCEIKPIQGAREKLQELKNKGYKLEIITARNEMFKDYTYNWINKYYPNIFDDIHFTGHFSALSIPKSEIGKKIGIKHMIEDNPEYAQDISSVGIKTFLLDKPWNKNLSEFKNIVKVKNWSEICVENIKSFT